jgi:AcrR family transcriptional regulator
MNALPKTKPDDTRDRIMDVADRLFRQMGFAKTTVADIAAELRMSPANVYRFFASKNAIVEAICRRCLAELDERAWEIARSRGSAAARLERLILEILAYHKANLLTDKRVNDIVLVAIEDSWNAIQAHKEIIRNVVELILRDGIAAGESSITGAIADSGSESISSSSCSDSGSAAASGSGSSATPPGISSAISSKTGGAASTSGADARGAVAGSRLTSPKDVGSMSRPASIAGGASEPPPRLVGSISMPLSSTESETSTA